MKGWFGYSATLLLCSALAGVSDGQVRFANDGPIRATRAPNHSDRELGDFAPFHGPPPPPGRFESLPPNRHHGPPPPPPQPSLRPSDESHNNREREESHFQPHNFHRPPTQQLLQAVRPVPVPTAGAPLRDRSQSRFQTSQLAGPPRQHNQAEENVNEPEYEDYSDEPDRLSILLAESQFECDPADTGYFSDKSVNCEVFHYCSQGVKHSWICPDGNIFHQINLICQPASSDNICERSNDFHFVNDYLYQLVRNDSSRPEYADRFYPENYHHISSVSQSRHHSGSPSQHAPPQERRHRPVEVTEAPRIFTASPEPHRFEDRPVTFLTPVVTQQQQQQQQQQQSSSSSIGRLSPQAVRRLVERPRPAFLRPHTIVPAAPAPNSLADFEQAQTRRQRAPEPVRLQPLPPVRAAANPFPDTGSLNPSIRSRGTPVQARRLQERHDLNQPIVVGGFQGNIDIHDLVSNNERQF